jgi:hypothetical protein
MKGPFVSSQSPSCNPRGGFIAAFALFAVIIIGAIGAAVSFNVTEETQVTSMDDLDERAESFGEQVALGAMANWPWPGCDQSALGTVFIVDAQSAPPLEGTLYITRLDSALYLVTGEGRVKTRAGVLARRRISLTASARRDSTGAMRPSRTRGEYWAANYEM